MTVIEADAPPAVKVSVSAPSVKTSAASATVIVACPLVFTTALPLNAPPTTSAADKPLIVYGTDVPAVTLVVDKVKVAVEPSFVDPAAAERA